MNWLALTSLGVSIISNLVGFLVLHWIRSSIKIAMLELERSLDDKYASQNDFDELKDRVDRFTDRRATAR